MRILLDTNTLLWWWWSDRRLSASARELLRDPDTVALVSPVSAFEIATKVRIGKLTLGIEPADVPAATRRSGFQELPVSLEQAAAAGALPGDHRDPFDRLLAAQAHVEGIPIVTNDAAFGQMGVSTIW